jgi:tRNA(Ile)-lysidine synthase
LVVAVSGGPDSLALLHLLVSESIHPAKNLIVVHLDHALRPSSADDAAFVRDYAGTMGAPSAIMRIDVRELASEEGLTIEEAGRNARYEYLAEVAECNKSTVVVTGHTANDQAETILMNLLRGSGPKGLRGMQPISTLPGSDSIFLARPLLSVTKVEIEAYCAANELNPIQDKSNLDPTYYRNWIRLELLPKITERNPGLVDRLNQTAKIIAADYELLDDFLSDTWSFLVKDSGQGWLRLDMGVWRVLPTSLKRSTLRKAVSLIRNDAADIGFQTIELARKVAENGQVGSESSLPDGVTLTIGYDDLVIAAEGIDTPSVDVPQLPNVSPIRLPVPGEVPLAANWMIRTRIINQVDTSAAMGNGDPLRAFVVLPENAELEVRPVLKGERFQPLGLEGHSASVRDVMVNRKIPRASRGLWPIVATTDHLIWLAGHQIDHRVRVQNSGNAAVLLSLVRVDQAASEQVGFIPLEIK